MTPGRRGSALGPARRRLAAWLLRRADRANRAGDWARAERFYARVLALQPHLSPVLVQYGHALKEQGFPHAAAAAYRRAAALSGAVADPWAQLGHVLNVLDRPREAASAFSAALAIDPGAPGLREERDHAVSASYAAATLPEPIALLLEAHDLPPAAVTMLDEPFYRAHDASLATADRRELVDHVGRVGIDRLLPLNARARFDPDFYRSTYPGVGALGPARAYRHWLTLGVRMGWAPNRAAWLDGLFGTGVQRLRGAARRFAEAAMAVEAGAAPAAPPFAWLVAPARPPLPEVGSAEEGVVWAMLADGLDKAGLSDASRRLRNAGAERWPSLVDAAVVIADRGGWTGSAYADHAAARAAAEDWLGAIAVLGEGVRRYPGDAGLGERLETVADRAIHAAWASADRLAAAGASLDDARAGLAATLEAVVAALPKLPALPRRAIAAIAIVGNADLPQCRFYRIEQKLEHLAAAGYEAAFFDERTDVPRFLAAILRFQAVIFYRVPAHLHVIKAVLAARALGLVTVYEIDDLLFDAAHYPAPIESYGGEFSPADHWGLALAVPMYAAAMALCDDGLASTDALAGAMRPHVRTHQVFVHPNGFGSAHAAFAALAPPVHAPGKVTIFYGSHTKAHKADVEALVEPALAAVVARYGEAISILLVGFVPLTPTLQALGDRLTILDPMSLAEYWALLATSDIVVAPLFRSPATDAKSEIKWLEAAMLGLPTVVSRTATAERVIVDGVTGFLCETAAEWIAVLDRLVASPNLRRAVGIAAKTEALRRYAPERGAENLRGIVEALSPPPAGRKARVAIVNVFYPPQDFGGATRVVNDNVRDLGARHGSAFDIEVFATLDVGGEPCRMRSVPHEGVRVTTATAGSGDAMAPASPAMGRAFGAFLDMARPDLVHFHCVQRLTVAVVEEARRRAIPYLITVHDGWWISSHQFLLDEHGKVSTYDYGNPLATLKRDGRAAFERLLALSPALLGARAVLAVSNACAALYTACHVPNVVAVPNGVSALPVPVRPPHPGGPVRLGYVGGLYPHKGWPLIGEALRALPNADAFTLLAVDHGMAAGDRRIEQWGDLMVEVRGKVPPAAVGELYACIDILLAPSLWPESFGLVTREALHCGCWVIASDRGAIGADIAEGINGFVVDVSSPAGLVDALTRVAADPARFRSSPPPSRLRRAEHQADDLALLYGSILATPPPSG